LPAVVLNGQRSFAAAKVDRLLAYWQPDYGFTTADLRNALPTIRSRSREMAKNSPTMKRFLHLVESNIVGRGFTLKSMPREGDRIDSAAAIEIETQFWKWANNRKTADVAGQKTFAEICRLNAKSWARDGEYIVRFRRDVANSYGFSLQVIRPDMLDHSYCIDQLPNGNRISCGIERNSDSRPVRYWFRTGSTSQISDTLQPTGELVGIPASEILHGYIVEDELQPRGIPWAHAVLAKLKMLDEYDVAELTAARDEACSVRTYYADRGQTDEIEDITEDDGETANALTAPKEPGQAEVLPIGYKMQVHTPQHPANGRNEFKANLLRDVASGLNLEYCTMANDLAGANFTSIRAGTLVERDMWMLLQDRMIEQFVSPVFHAWLDMYLLSGNTKLPSGKREKFQEHEFRGRRWKWVQPIDDMRAAELARRYGWQTDSDITAEMGGDYDDNIATIKRESEQVKGSVLAPVHDNRETKPVTGGQNAQSNTTDK
jgi:lambda family phage portal protein